MDHFVGRQVELATLDAALTAVRGGRPRVVLVEGEAGTGKSSLVWRFVSAHPDALVVSASGDETEMLLSWGVVDQLGATKALATARPPWEEPTSGKGSDATAVGAKLVQALGDLQIDDRVILVVVDDLHWSDQLSAQALLFALRRMRTDRVLGLVTSRPDGLHRLGEAWGRFVAGDERATRLRLGGLSTDDVVTLARVLGAGELSSRTVDRFLKHTGGNALHCRALLEELGQSGLGRSDEALPAPRALASVVVARLGNLSEPTQRLVRSAAVLGRRCPVAVAAALAGVADPLAALDEAVAAGLVVEDSNDASVGVAFAHPLVHAAVRDDLGPAARRQLHRVAATLVSAPAALTHRVAAAVGPDDVLADDLEEAARKAAPAGQTAQAAAWLAQAAAMSTDRSQKDRRLLDAVAVLLGAGDVAAAVILWPSVSELGPSARRSALAGHLDLLCGRGSVVEAHLLEAWQAHDARTEPSVGAAAATNLAAYLCTIRRLEEAVVWAERAVSATSTDPAAHLQALIILALALTLVGRSPEGLARLGLPEAASEVPLEHTDALTVRGMSRLFTDDPIAAVSDLSTAVARMREGVSLRYPGQCLVYLSEAEYRLGAWDDVVVHAQLAVSLTRDADRTWDLAFVHAMAALVPAARGDWAEAGVHVDAARAAARAFGTGTGLMAAARAAAELGLARGDLEEVLSATSAVRALGRDEVLGVADWRPFEADALTGLGRLDDAEAAVRELEAAIPASGLGSVSMTVARLRGNLAVARGDMGAAGDFFGAAWRLAQDLPLPFQLAVLERDDGRRLRKAGDLQGAVARFRGARDRLDALGARPYLQQCENELRDCGVDIARHEGQSHWNLTPAELGVARLVCTGLSNREVASELYVSVKAIEFHLGNIYDKVGVRSRRVLAQVYGNGQ